MPLHIIIDGYNLIRQSEIFSLFDLQDIQSGREALIDALAQYRKVKRHRVTVVFDGTDAVGMDRQQQLVKGIHVLFSRYGETADTVIKKMAASQKEKALVVSSDREIVEFSSSVGAGVIDSRQFEKKLKNSAMDHILGKEENASDGWKPTTKKKGPRRRLPRKKRRSRLKINKL